MKFTDITLEQGEQNVGSGIDYLGQQLVNGFTRAIEGAADAVVGIPAFLAGKVFNNEDALNYAERKFTTDWFDYEKATRDFNPSKGWKIAGDVASGIGNSLPSLIVAGATGGIGNVSQAAIQAASLTALGISAYGSGVSEAVKKTGELGWKEVGYGYLSGLTEAGTEMLGDFAGWGSGRVLSAISSQFASDATKAISKSTAWAVVKRLGGDFLGEAFEEGVSALLEPAWGRLTGVDPEAKVDWKDVGYQALVGGLSGVMMGATGSQISSARSVYFGSEAVKNGSVNSILETARSILENQEQVGVSKEVVDTLQDTYDRLKESIAKNGNVVTTPRQKMLLGNLMQINVGALVNPLLQREAINILQNPEAIAQQISSFLTDDKGNKITITADDIRKGVTAMADSGKPYVQQVRSALMHNHVLQGLAILSFTGKLTMQTDAWVQFAAEHPGDITADELQQFVETASEQQKEEIGRLIGVDNWKKASSVEVSEAFARNHDKVMSAMQSAQSAKQAAQGEVKPAPKAFGSNKDGAYDIGDGYIVVKQGNQYRIVNKGSGSVTRVMTSKEVNQLLREKTNESLRAEEQRQNTVREEAEQKAREYVPNYDKLSESVKRSVRMTVMQAIENHVDPNLAEITAKISAKTGLNIVFSRDVLQLRDKENKIIYANGMYNMSQTVYVNPDAETLKAALVTMSHELSHWIWKNANAKFRKAMLENAVQALGAEKVARVSDEYEAVLKKKYKDANETLPDQKLYSLIHDEIQAAYAEELGGNDDFWEAILKEDETLKSRIPSFLRKWAEKVNFKQAKTAAEAYQYAFTKAFQRLSTANMGSNAFERSLNVRQGMYNIAYEKQHRQDLDKNYDEKSALQSKEGINAALDRFTKIWQDVTAIMDSKFLKEWNEKKGRDGNFSVFKEQSGYKYNIELSTMCKKGVPLFEAIDAIVRKELKTQMKTDVIGKQEKEALYRILKKHGYEIPCAICYVEQARQREGAIIKKFLNGDGAKIGWNSTLDEISRKMAEKGVEMTFGKFGRDITTDKYNLKPVEMSAEQANAFYEALMEITNREIEKSNKSSKTVRPLIKEATPQAFSASLKGNVPTNLALLKALAFEPKSRKYIDNDMLYSSYVTQNVAGVHPMLYSLFNRQGGVSGYKSKQRPVIYLGDILTKGFKSGTVRNAGGIRNQSNSDLQMYLLMDMVQMYADAAAKGYYIHAYTKVPAELKILGLSGAKINASLIPKVHVYRTADGEIDYARTVENAGLGENGELLFDTVEGINPDEAFMIAMDKLYSKSVGTICIGYSDKHIEKLLDDPRVQLIIGFHDNTDKPEKRYPGARFAKNYRGLNEAKDASGETKHITFGKYLAAAEKKFGYNASTETHTKETTEFNGKTYKYDDIPKLAADMYKAELAEKGWTVAYANFADHPNYYKLLADFSLYDSEGHYAPHKKVQLVIPETVPVIGQNGQVEQIDTGTYIERMMRKELETLDNLSADLADDSPSGMLAEMVDAINHIRDDMPKSPIFAETGMYSLPHVDPVVPTDGWKRSQTFDEVKEQHPDLWDVSADESSEKNPTSVKVTVASYDKIYSFLKDEGFEGKILDASSGLGYGTELGKDKYGFDVVDVEPYPGERHEPDYRDYAKIPGQYDVIISNAVLNVLPQDLRDSLVVRMGELLAPGGRIFVNVRGEDVMNASSKVILDKDNLEVFISGSGSYQKGFKKSELVAYLKDALGEGYDVEAVTFFGKTSAVVTKKEGLSVDESRRKAVPADGKLSIFDLEPVEPEPEPEPEPTPEPATKTRSKAYEVFKNNLEHITSNYRGFYLRFWNDDDYLGALHIKEDLSVLDELKDVLATEDFDPVALDQYYKFAYWLRLDPKVLKKLGTILYAKVNITDPSNSHSVWGVSGVARLSEVEQLFNKYNRDSDLKELASRVFRAAGKLGVNIRFSGKVHRNADAHAFGDMVEYKTSYFNDLYYTDQEKASTLVHELIHTVTMYAIDIYNKPELWENIELSENMKKAVRQINDIWEDLRSTVPASEFNERGKETVLQNPKEMLAYITDQEVADIYKRYSLWDRIVDAICRFLGITRSSSSAYVALRKLLDYMIDNPNVSAYGEYAYNVRDHVQAGWVRGAKETFETPDGKSYNRDGLPTRNVYSTYLNVAEAGDIKATQRQIDSDYLKAVSSGNMDTAQRLVDEAAKKAGYNTPLLYHGTNEFGFTKFDLERSGDLIFATSSEAVAGTYTWDKEKRSISEPDRPADKAYIKMFDNFQQLTIENAEHISSIIGKKGYLDPIDFRNAIMVAVDREDYFALEEIGSAFMNDYFESKELDGDINEWLESEDALKLYDALDDEVSPALNAYREYRAAHPQDGGLYSLYGRMNNPFIMDANGEGWGSLTDDRLPARKEPYNTRQVARWAKGNGYDSVLIKNVRDTGDGKPIFGDVYIFFSEDQVKSADPVTYDDDGNVIPLSQRFNSKVPDVRYSLPDGYEFKRYTKKEAEEIVNRIMENIEYTEGERSYNEDEWDSNIFKPKLIGKSRKQAINQIFEMLNSAPAGERFNPALRIADYLIDHVIMHEIVVGTDASAVAAQFIDAMNQYRHNIRITDKIKSEAKYVFDDKANEIWMQWAAPKGTRGMDPDVIAMEMRSQGIYLGDVDVDGPAQQIFHQLLQHYEHCKSMLDEKAAKIKLREFGSEQALKDYRQGIAKDLLRAYDEFGTISKEGKAVERVRGQYERKLGEQRKGYEKRIDALKGVFEEQKQKLLDKLKNSYKKNQVENRVVDLARKLKDGAIRKYVSSTVLSNPILEKWEKELGKLVLRGNLRKANSRNILLTYEKFYNAKNQPLMDWLAETSEDGKGELDPNVLGAFEVIKNAKKETASGVPLPLSYEELKAAEVILGSAEALFRNYDAAFLEGKRYTTRQLAEDEMKFLMSKEFKKIKHFVKLTQTIQKWFNYTVEPRVVIRMLERYDPKGFLTRMYNEILQGETAAEYQRVQFMLPFEEFFKKNKGYQKRLASATIDFHGETLTLNQAIALYETTKRAQAQKGLACSGFSYEDKDGNTHHVKGTMETNLTDEDYEDNAVWFRKTIESSLTKEDKEFIKLVENFFNVESKNAKTEADLNFLGYTNVLDEFYFPIVRDRTTIARSTMDVRSFLKDVAALNNFSFNKDTKPKAATELHIGNVYDMVQTHAKQMSVYANLAQPMQTFDRVYNKNIGEKTDVRTVRKFVDENIWKGASAYLQKLFSDIQGVVMPNEDFNLFGALRGGYAKYQLGANLKVILSQTASFPTAAIVLSPKAMLRGFFRKIDFKAMDKYCPYAFTRNHDQVVVKAEGVIDKVGKIGDATTKPIQWTDRLTIGVLWNASQAQVQEEKGYVFGTEENMKEAGKLLEQVIRQTQPNYSNTERSAMMRSTHEAAKVFSMFTSAPLKQYSRLVEAAGELSYAVQTKNAKAKADAAKKLGRAISAILIANAMYCMIGQFISWLFKKKRREDEEGNEISFAEDYLTDIAVTTIGMMPGMNQIASYFTKGYGVSGFVYDTVNDFLMDSKNIVSLIGKAASGQPVERYEFGSVLRRSVYTAGELTGIPVRNIMNTVTGMMRRFAPEAGYAVDSFFYATDYRTDLSEYMNHGNTDMAEYLLKLYTKDNTGTMSKEARDVLLNLYTQGYDVLPKAVGNTLSYTYTDANGETKTESYKLTANQKKQFKYLYSKANPVIESMLNDRVFKKLSEEDQAKAIKSVNTAYFMMAKDEVTKTKTTNNTLLTFFRKDIGKFATILAGLNEIGTDKDKKGNAVSGTKKKNVYKYLTTSGLSKQEAVYVMAVKGYTLSGLPVSEESATTMLLKYIMSLPVTQAEKAAIAERCGFTVKGNRILRKKS